MILREKIKLCTRKNFNSSAYDIVLKYRRLIISHNFQISMTLIHKSVGLKNNHISYCLMDDNYSDLIFDGFGLASHYENVNRKIWKPLTENYVRYTPHNGNYFFLYTRIQIRWKIYPPESRMSDNIKCDEYDQVTSVTIRKIYTFGYFQTRIWETLCDDGQLLSTIFISWEIFRRYSKRL